MKKRRIIQLTPSISHGDAVSNDIFAMSEVLTLQGFDNYIVSIGISDSVKNRAISFKKYAFRESDILIYHMSIGSELSDFVMNVNLPLGKKIMVYHNITPADFFDSISSSLRKICHDGREQLKRLAKVIDFAICDSDYNKRELDALGYKMTKVLPIVFDKTEYLSTPPNSKILSLYDNDYTNILFVGRITPNKKQEDVIQSFHIYNKYINPKSRLFLVGAVVSTEKYMAALEDYLYINHISDVIFSGHVSFPDIIAYYKLADVFLCESEHEGFCVPLLEAMTFNIPIVAYASTAIPNTLGRSGLIFTEKNHPYIAELINIVVSNSNLRNKIINSQQKRLESFNISYTKHAFEEMIKPWII